MIRQFFHFTGAGEDFGPRSDGLVTAHTTESPYNKLTVADAVVLARWQDRADVAGSYNDLICVDGILQCMPSGHASGGINPGSASFAPEPWLYDLMSREMVHNPNYFTRNVSFMGSKAWFDANGWPPEMIDNFVTVMLEEEKRIGSRVILTDHEDFQTNRSDAGPIANALIRQRYLERTRAPQEDDMYEWASRVQAITPVRVTFRPETSYRIKPDLSAESRPRVYGELTRIVIGTVQGVDFGAGPTWLVLVSQGGHGLLVAHSQDEVRREPLASVTTGATPEQVQQAVDSAVAALNSRIDAAQQG